MFKRSTKINELVRSFIYDIIIERERRGGE